MLLPFQLLTIYLFYLFFPWPLVKQYHSIILVQLWWVGFVSHYWSGSGGFSKVGFVVCVFWGGLGFAGLRKIHLGKNVVGTLSKSQCLMGLEKWRRKNAVPNYHTQRFCGQNWHAYLKKRLPVPYFWFFGDWRTSTLSAVYWEMSQTIFAICWCRGQFCAPQPCSKERV